MKSTEKPLVFIAYLSLGGSRGRLGRRLKTDRNKEAAVSAGMAAGADPAEGGGGKPPLELDLEPELTFENALHPGRMRRI